MNKLVAVIITKNEAHNVTDCIDSLRDWVDAVVVWDAYSDDDTKTVAEKAGATVHQREWDNFAAQRQAALDGIASEYSGAEWILFIDADERATPAFGAEVQQRIETAGADAPVGYWLPRRNFIVGHEMKWGGYFPDYQLRLLKRGKANYVAEREVHEIVDLDGADGHLNEPIIHINYTSWSQFHTKQRFYSQYEAKILQDRGIRPRPHNFILQPLREFRRRTITLSGWRDGVAGLRLALLLAWYYGFMPYWYMLR